MDLVPGFDGLQKFGRNTAISLAADEDVWTVGGLYVFPPGAERLSLVSSDDEDQPGGDGCGSVEVQGLGDGYIPITETVDLDGDQVVLTDAAFLRAPRGICRTPGSGSTTDRNLGTITVTQQSSGITMFNIPAGVGQTLMAIYTVPADQVLILNRVYASVGRQVASALTAQLDTRPLGECWQAKNIVDGNSQGSSLAAARFEPGTAYGAKTDIKILASVSGNGVDVNAGFDGYLYDATRFIQGN
jgi:hypothetical protein